ncbi:progonadoliberin-1 [Ictalurus punctatus]|nr:progonadoliberin-1 [Ictalurus punctatus]
MHQTVEINIVKSRRTVCRATDQGRMCVKRALWWMVVCVVVLQVSSQHWSHGLNPGGKRAALQETVEEMPRTSGYVCDYVDVSPRNKLYRLKDLLTSVAEREIGQ